VARHALDRRHPRRPQAPRARAARLLEAELRERGRRAFSVEQAKALFEQHGSAPPMTASAADIDELARDAQRALYHVASGLPARAKADVERALGRARKALESLNRETRAAQHLLDACLYLVRAHLQNNSRNEARRQALECRRLVPDIAPEPTVHPPDVIGVLAEAQADLRAHEPASLRIESEPMGCAAYVNGRNLGPTPKELSRLSPGEYRIQAECEQGVMGRVHRVALSDNRVVLKVDTRYDRAIETLFDLSLNYAGSSEERRHLGRDAVETGRMVGASDVVVAWVRGDGPAPDVQVDRYRVADGVHLGFARLRVDGAAGTIEQRVLARAREALEAGESVDLRGPTPRVLPQPALATQPATRADTALQARAPAPAPEEALFKPEAEPPAQADDAHDTDVMPIVGYALAGAGVAAQVTGWVLYGRLLGRQDSYAAALNANTSPMTRTTPELNALRDIDAADEPPPIALGVGALMTTASVPLWLPQTDAIPWWGWASGGAGLVLAGVGAVLSVSAAGCEVDRYDRCTQAPLATDIGPLLLLQSMPLLAVPVVQGVRELTGDRARLDVQVGQGSAMLRLEGSL